MPFEKIKEWKNFDADTGKDSAREFREYFIPDFSKWKHHDKYQAALNGSKGPQGRNPEANLTVIALALQIQRDLSPFPFFHSRHFVFFCREKFDGSSFIE